MSKKNGWKRSRLVALFLVFVAVAAVGMAYASPNGFQALFHKERHKVIIVGADCMTWDIAQPLMDEGKMPNTQYLVDNGVHGTLWSMDPMLSPRIWTTAATGKMPEEHGILGFTVENSTKPGGAEFYTSNFRREKALWNILTEHGKKVGYVHHLVTWPAEEVNGFIVSDRALNPHEKDAVWPADAKQEVREVVDDHIEYLRDIRNTTSYLGMSRRDEMANVIGLHLKEEYDPDLFFVYYRQLDGACHTYIDRDYNKVEEAYEYFDVIVGDIIAEMDEDTTLFIISDHGCGHGNQSRRGQGLNWTLSQHRMNGVIMAMGPEVKKGYDIGNVSVAGMAQTTLYALDMPIGMDMTSGRVYTEIFKPIYVEENPVRFVSSYGSIESIDDATPLEGISDQEEIARLRALGYLG